MEKGVPIRALSRGLAVLQAINRGGSLSMVEISRTAEVPYPTACRIVQTLQVEGLIEQEPSRKRYRPTAMVQTLAHGFEGHSALTAVARPFLVELTREIGWPITLSTLVGHSMVMRDSTHHISALTFNCYYPGHSFPVLDSACGQVHIAHMPDEERKELFRALRLLPRRTNMHALKLFETTDLAEQIRRQGYATRSFNQFTRNPGKTSSIAAPVFDADGIAGGITLAFFSSAMGLEEAVEKFVRPIVEKARMISDAASGGVFDCIAAE